ncbi:MAG: BON domain-containing protein [Betaproteobacteria bacterium]
MHPSIPFPAQCTTAAVAGVLLVVLSGCEQKPASSGPIVRADLQSSPVSKPLERRTEEPATRSSTIAPLVAQAPTPSEAPAVSPLPQPPAPDVRPRVPTTPPAAGKPAAARPINDAELVGRVKAAVLAQPLSALLFNVNVSNGVVTLSGTADSAETRDKAGRAAADVEGVRSVNNRINVLSGS